MQSSSQVVEAFTYFLTERVVGTLFGFGSANVHEEFSNLVGIHAGSRNFDGTSPVVVVVTESKSQLFNGLLVEFGVIVLDKEMSRQHTTLSSLLGYQVEVKFDIRFLFFYHFGVDEASGDRVHNGSSFILHEESLVDPLVDNDDSESRFLSNFVVGNFYGCLELADFIDKYFLSHGISHTISVHNQMVRQHLLGVSLLVSFKCLNE
jgi:hypothetical protein